MMIRKAIKPFFCLFIFQIVLSSLIFQGCKKPHSPISSEAIKTEDAPQYIQSLVPNLTIDRETGLSSQFIIIKTTKGVLKFSLYPNDAPETVKRFMELAKSNFYNGLKFQRVIPNFVVQGGDPTGTGHGGSGRKLKAEFNKRNHVRGTLAMARQSDPDSADSQFYIALSTLPHLDGKYTVFGQIIDGDPVLDKITQEDKIISIEFSENNSSSRNSK